MGKSLVSCFLTHSVDAARCCRRRGVVQLCLCSDTTGSRAKPAEPIEMPFGLWTRLDPRNHVFGGGPGFPQEKGQFRDVTSTPLILSVDDLVDWARDQYANEHRKLNKRDAAQEGCCSF